MEIGGAKNKNHDNKGNFSNDIQISGNPLETVDSFRYLGVMISEEGSKSGVLGLSHMSYMEAQNQQK